MGGLTRRVTFRLMNHGPRPVIIRLTFIILTGQPSVFRIGCVIRVTVSGDGRVFDLFVIRRLNQSFLIIVMIPVVPFLCFRVVRKFILRLRLFVIGPVMVLVVFPPVFSIIVFKISTRSRPSARKFLFVVFKIMKLSPRSGLVVTLIRRNCLVKPRFPVLIRSVFLSFPVIFVLIGKKMSPILVASRKMNFRVIRPRDRVVGVWRRSVRLVTRRHKNLRFTGFWLGRRGSVRREVLTLLPN